MKDEKIQNEGDLKRYIEEARGEREQLRAEVEAAREQAEETAQEVYSLSLADFHARASRQIQDLAEQHGLSFSEALTKFGNALAPRPPGYTREPRAGSVVDLSQEERAERAELRRLLAGRDLSGLTKEQRASMSLGEQEFLTRPRDDTEGV